MNSPKHTAENIVNPSSVPSLAVCLTCSEGGVEGGGMARAFFSPESAKIVKGGAVTACDRCATSETCSEDDSDPCENIEQEHIQRLQLENEALKITNEFLLKQVEVMNGQIENLKRREQQSLARSIFLASEIGTIKGNFAKLCGGWRATSDKL